MSGQGSFSKCYWDDAFFSFFNAQTMHNKSKTYNSIAICVLKNLHPVGIRTTASEAAVISTAPRRQAWPGILLYILYLMFMTEK
jgi:hypothetical protein